MGNHQMRRCAHCGSLNTQAGLDEILCLACGNRTRSTGEKVAPEPKFEVKTAADLEEEPF